MAARLSPDIDMVIANVAKYTAEANVPTLYMDAEAVAEGKSYEKTSSGPVLRLTPAEALERMLNNDIPNFTHGMVVRRSLFGRIDWDTYPSMTNAEDAMLQLLLASAATGAVVQLPDVVAYEYRQRPGTLSSMSGKGARDCPLRQGSFLFYPNGVNLILPKGVNHARLFHTSQNEIQFN